MTGTDFTVFVVNDDMSALGCLTRLLRSNGYRTSGYSCPKTFLDKHDWAKPGCVVLDLKMKTLNGLQVQQRLADQQMERPIIFVAARCSMETCVQAMKAGAMDLLRKPVDQHKLFNAIERAKERDNRIRCADAERNAISALEHRLSPRQREVLLM